MLLHPINFDQIIILRRVIILSQLICRFRFRRRLRRFLNRFLFLLRILRCFFLWLLFLFFFGFWLRFWRLILLSQTFPSIFYRFSLLSLTQTSRGSHLHELLFLISIHSKFIMIIRPQQTLLISIVCIFPFLSDYVSYCFCSCNSCRFWHSFLWGVLCLTELGHVLRWWLCFLCDVLIFGVGNFSCWSWVLFYPWTLQFRHVFQWGMLWRCCFWVLVFLGHFRPIYLISRAYRALRIILFIPVHRL